MSPKNGTTVNRIKFTGTCTNKKSSRPNHCVDIFRYSEEILGYILGRVQSDGGQVMRFSLYLSAQLLYGTVKVFDEQNKFLLGKW